MFIGFPLEVPEGVSPLSILIIIYNFLIGFLAVFFIWLLLLSHQALLPVSNLNEIRRTGWNLILFILRKHGPAIFVKDGAEISTSEDLKREGPGVVVVDFNSAVVLETRISALGLSRPTSRLLIDIGRLLGLSDPPVSPRACGPGIVFTNPRERVRGAVDLRKQFRLLRDVHCYTREGIELYANVHATFTIGQIPDVLEVTYEGDRRLENLRVVSFEHIPGGHLRVTGISSTELDQPDSVEVHHYAQVTQRTNEWFEYTTVPRPGLLPVFDPNRVFAAVFAQARNEKQEVLAWTDLPTRVASGIFREIISQVKYDELYDIRGNGYFPLPQYKRRLSLEMRNNGILSYRMIFHRDGAPLEKGRIYRESDLIVSVIRPMTNSKMLRDRGIRVLFSGFGDLSPVSEAVLKQRLDAWRASWDHDLEIRRAEGELTAMRNRSRAHAQAMRDLTFSLSQILSNQEHAEEAMVLRIMQAIEQAAADPKTRQLLPANTIDLIRFINQMINPNFTPPSLPPVGSNVRDFN
jgi:hypothetical protein